jgi:hypothetical protein
MTLTFRRDLSRNLTANEADGNVDDLNGRLTTVEGGAASGGISSFTISGTILTLTFTDTSVMSVDIGDANAFVLGNHLKGVWQPSTAYIVNDIFTYQGTLYCVVYDHTSASSFDENATSGGHAVYKVICRYNQGVYTVSTTTVTPDATFANKYIRCTNTAGCTVMLNGGVFAPADYMTFRQCGAGPIVFDWPTGVTVNGVDGFDFTTLVKGAVVNVFVVGANEYDFFGLQTPVTG